MTPEEIAAIESYLADLRAATVRYGQDAFRRENAAEVRRHADRLDELDRADVARVALVDAIEALRRALAAFPPLPAEETPVPPPSLASKSGAPHTEHLSPVATTLADDLDGEQIILREGNHMAHGLRRGNEWVVLSGSEARNLTHASMPVSSIARRAELLGAGVLVVSNSSTLRFTQDVSFSSPSAAAQVILGRSANGRTEWRRLDGRTLHSESAV